MILPFISVFLKYAGNNSSTNHGLSDIGGTSGWELALVTTSTNTGSHLGESKLVLLAINSFITSFFCILCLRYSFN